ncbi:hypothetical protein [Tateyamaria pelophila]|uniref:hypothetical protein n=1 Tax=Tateyamaria pelophila TaxID=328415 RepID=UPI001CBBE7C2|nr:hypothetical protein [Tateyamaria pelophila]
MIRIFDFETTPTEVCEAGWCDLKNGRITPPTSRLYGITGPIEPGARAVHHIRSEDLEGAPIFDGVPSAGVTVFAAHNASYELQFWTPPVPVICTYKAAMRIWPDAPSHKNFAVAYWLEDRGDVVLDHAQLGKSHRAGADAYATAHILKALMATGVTVEDMIGWAREPVLMSKIPLGKFRGESWSAADAGYLRWMLGSDMSDDLKWNAKRELDRR